MRHVAAALAAVLAMAALAGCGYQARFDVPPHLKTFTVATFTNKTLERNLDFEFTQALVREIHAKTRLRAAPPDEADLVITGEIDELSREVLRRKRGDVDDDGTLDRLDQ
jgi:outer membrane lipopolysaccharide assembly protein LptE/RlpB